MGILTLKRNGAPVVVVSDRQKLVDTGMYVSIRHPIHAGLLLELPGVGRAVSKWVSPLLRFVPNAASLTYRIFVEEKALESHSGKDDIQYERRTKRLIP